MALATIDYMGLLKDIPAGAWVAISEQTQEVIAYAADLQSVIDSARERGVDEPLVVRVPEQSGALFL
jgi:hypothetical protein